MLLIVKELFILSKCKKVIFNIYPLEYISTTKSTNENETIPRNA